MVELATLLSSGSGFRSEVAPISEDWRSYHTVVSIQVDYRWTLVSTDKSWDVAVLWLWMLPNDFTPYLSFSLSSCLSSERHAAFATHISLLLNMDQQTKTSVKGYKGNCWRESPNAQAWILYTYTQAETGKSHGPVQLIALQLWKTNELLHIWSSPCVEKLSLWATHTIQLAALQLCMTNELLHIWSSPCVWKLSLWDTHTHTHTHTHTPPPPPPHTHTHTHTQATNTSTPHTHVFFIAQLTIWLES